jgi:hypothetical protein
MSPRIYVGPANFPDGSPVVILCVPPVSIGDHESSLGWSDALNAEEEKKGETLCVAYLSASSWRRSSLGLGA